jgi:hypothetical protein
MENELEHVGVMGMRWGTRRGEKKANKLNKQVDKSIRRFDYGKGVSPNTFREQSRDVRKLAYKTNKRIARMNKYLDKAKKQPADKVISRFGRTPEKVAKVKDWLAASELQKTKLSELRSKLVDVKIDTF